jgi:hypothetical protein
MAEATTPAPNAAPPSTAVTAPQSAPQPGTGPAEAKTQPPAQKKPAVPPATTEKPAPATPDAATEALKSRADALARAARAEAKLLRDKAAFEASRTQSAEDTKLAADYRRLEKLLKDDPVAYAEAVGLKLGDLARRSLEKQGKKTPEQVAEEVYTRKAAEKVEADKKAADEAAEKQRLADVAAKEASYAGAKKKLADMAAADPVKYELCSVFPAPASVEAFELVTKFWDKAVKETGVGQFLTFDKALDAVEAKYKLAKERKLSQDSEKKKAEEAEAAKKKAPPAKSNTAARSVDSREHVETEVKPSPQPKPLRRLMPRDIQRKARELLLERSAKQDS